MIARPIAAALACLLAWPVLSACSGSPGSTQPQTASAPASASAPAEIARLGSTPLGLGRARLKGGGFALGNRSGEDADKLLLRMMVYVVVILAIGGVALFLIKRVLPKIRSTKGSTGISVLETVYLGPKKSLHLLQVGSQRFLVAGSRDRITMLGKVTLAFPDDSEPAVAPETGERFESILKGKGVDPVADKS